MVPVQPTATLEDHEMLDLLNRIAAKSDPGDRDPIIELTVHVDQCPICHDGHVDSCPTGLALTHALAAGASRAAEE